LGECLGCHEDHSEFLNDFNVMYRRHLDGNEVTGSVSVSAIHQFVMTKLDSMPATLPSRPRGHGKRRRVTSCTSTSSSSTMTGSVSPTSTVLSSPESPNYNLEFPALRASAQLATPSRISAMLVSLETRPDDWRVLQFEHISRFPKLSCDACRARFCFQCGEPSWHDGQSCLEYMQSAVHRFERRASLQSSTSAYTTQPSRSAIATRSSVLNRPSEDQSGPLVNADDVANMKWKLENSKACPRCCILINRDDGCNKVDCTMCGLRFCWICRSPWSEKCGFYRCQTEASSPITNPGTKMDETPRSQSVPAPSDMPELGVPDVTRIHARLASSQAERS
jgi:hypothetical protein